MPDVLEQRKQVVTDARRPPAPRRATERAPDERAARRTLLDQIERLEWELGSVFVASWPRKGLDFSVAGRAGPRVLSLDDLEALRDDLAHRLHEARRGLGERTYAEECNRRRIEAMLLEPEKHKWVRISAEDVGERGCKHWHVRPRWGLLGMLMNWWRVRISSGCPLAEGRRRAR